MAEAVFNKLCGDRGVDMTAESAGLSTVTGLPAAQNSRTVMMEQGIDISDFRSTSIEDKDMDSFDVFAVMTVDQKYLLRYYGVVAEKIYVLSEETGGISDPYGGSEGRYRQCRDEITAAVEELLRSLTEEL